MSAAVAISRIYELLEIFSTSGILKIEWKPIGIWVEFDDGFEDEAEDALAALHQTLQEFDTTADKRLFFGHFLEAFEQMESIECVVVH